MRIPEPLVESCDWSQDLSRADQDSTCAWYHGNWQYLRLLDLVSNPANHTDFYLGALREAAGQLDGPRVAICGAADYSMLAHVHAALGTTAKAVVYDVCPTPLVANEWYALQCGLPRPALVRADVAGGLPEAGFDALVTDSFLPRIKNDRLVPMLASWRDSLRDGGAIITTVRISGADEGDRQPFCDRFETRVRQASPWLAAVTKRPVDELVERLVSWVRRSEPTNFLAVDAVTEVFRAAGLEKVTVAESVVNGWRYAEIVAVR
jgi:hypothetical protein